MPFEPWLVHTNRFRSVNRYCITFNICCVFRAWWATTTNNSNSSSSNNSNSNRTRRRGEMADTTTSTVITTSNSSALLDSSQKSGSRKKFAHLCLVPSLAFPKLEIFVPDFFFIFYRKGFPSVHYISSMSLNLSVWLLVLLLFPVFWIRSALVRYLSQCGSWSCLQAEMHISIGFCRKRTY